jgi:hypothetical protein
MLWFRLMPVERIRRITNLALDAPRAPFRPLRLIRHRPKRPGRHAAARSLSGGCLDAARPLALRPGDSVERERALTQLGEGSF